LISGSVTSDEVKRGRPFPDMVLKAMELAGISDPNGVAKVGDTSSDMLQGTSAKCGLVIGVTTGAFTRQELENEPHTHIAESLQEVLHIIQSSHESCTNS
jgi:phosphoglycolate phosphatase-like HAD superfamily hydrolase